MKFENTEVFNFEGALRGMRQPLQSHIKSDSKYWLPNEYIDEYERITNEEISWTPYYIGENDMDLAQRLVKVGSPHRKFMRQIFVSVDITAPLFWWKECDTYKVATVANSTSTMHKLATTPITRQCFEMDDYEGRLGMIDPQILDVSIDIFLDNLEQLRQMYLNTKDIRYWKELIRWLPEGWLQTRTWTGNYEILRTIYFDRRNHKLIEWHKFCDWIAKLPYADELIMLEE